MTTFWRLAIALSLGAAVSAHGLIAQQATTEPEGAAVHAKSITIHQEVDFTASPQRLYEALLDAKQFVAFSGRPAEINREVGGAFSIFGGHIIGRNLELVPNRRIVQAWRVVTWPEGIYSIAKFELQAQGSGTRLILDHTGFPEGLKEHLAEGWEQNYWSLLKKSFH
jgi:activator of HSP90 ATPase